MHQQGVCRIGPFTANGFDIGRFSGGDQSRRRSSADSHNSQRKRIQICTAFDKPKSASNVFDFERGGPVDRGVPRLRITFALAAKIKRDNRVSRLQQAFCVCRRRPVASLQFRAEQNHTFCQTMGLAMNASTKGDAVTCHERDLFSIGNGGR